MAEGLLRHYAGDRFQVYSAGTEPERVHPLAIAAMQDVGIDISYHRSKSVLEFLGRAKIDYAIFVCPQAERNCPSIYPFALKKLSWACEDPAAVMGSEEDRMLAFCEVRDQLMQRIATWLSEQESTSFTNDE